MDSFDTVFITACATVMVAIIGSVVTIWNSNRARKDEHKLALLKVLLEAAYKEYEFRATKDIEDAKARNQEPKIKSFTEYIIFYKEWSTLFTKDDITEQELIEAL